MTALTAIAPQPKTATAPERLVRELDGIVHLLTCGSVDDGKSTLIGRMLWDASDLYEDQRETFAASRTHRRRHRSRFQPAARRPRRRARAGHHHRHRVEIFRHRHAPLRHHRHPGHEQYTRNMATGASHADVAIVLVDARSGVKKQDAAARGDPRLWSASSASSSPSTRWISSTGRRTCSARSRPTSAS